MTSVVALDRLLDARRVWRGQAIVAPAASQPTGHAALDAALPGGGWPEAALSEILLAAPGTGELHLLWPTLARLTMTGERVVLVDPPHLPYPQAWLTAGVDLRQLSIVQASGRDALWRPNHACARAAVAPCCAGRGRRTTAPCGACRWPQKPDRRWPSPIVRRPKR